MMASGAMQQALPQLGRSISTGAATAMAGLVPSSVASTKVGSGLTSLFTAGGSRIDTPLSVPLLSLPEQPRSHLLSVRPELRTSSVAGVSLAAIESASPLSSVALFVPAGSAYESNETAGASKILEHMAFKATQNRTTFRLTRELEKIGATPSVVVGRELASFTISTTKLHTAEAVEMLLDSVLNAKFNFHEVKEVVESSQQAAADLFKRPQAVLEEIAHHAAFDGGLSQPLLVDPGVLGALTADSLRSYFTSRLAPTGLLLAAVGAEHSDLVQLAQPLLEAAPLSGEATDTPASKYVGGSISVLNAKAPLTHTLLAFEAQGGYADAKATALAQVVTALLQEGLRAHPTLPRSRPEHDIFRSLQPYNALYQRTGLLGALVSSVPSNASAALDALFKKFEALAKGTSDAALHQAKSTVIADYKAGISTSTGLVQAIGRSLMAGRMFDPNGQPSAVAAVSAGDVKSFVAKLLKSPPTLATYGNLASLPRYDSIVKRFK